VAHCFGKNQLQQSFGNNSAKFATQWLFAFHFADILLVALNTP